MKGLKHRGILAALICAGIMSGVYGPVAYAADAVYADGTSAAAAGALTFGSGGTEISQISIAGVQLTGSTGTGAIDTGASTLASTISGVTLTNGGVAATSLTIGSYGITSAGVTTTGATTADSLAIGTTGSGFDSTGNLAVTGTITNQFTGTNGDVSFTTSNSGIEASFVDTTGVTSGSITTAGAVLTWATDSTGYGSQTINEVDYVETMVTDAAGNELTNFVTATGNSTIIYNGINTTTITTDHTGITITNTDSGDYSLIDRGSATFTTSAGTTTIEGGDIITDGNTSLAGGAFTVQASGEVMNTVTGATGDVSFTTSASGIAASFTNTTTGVITASTVSSTGVVNNWVTDSTGSYGSATINTLDSAETLVVDDAGNSVQNLTTATENTLTVNNGTDITTVATDHTGMTITNSASATNQTIVSSTDVSITDPDDSASRISLSDVGQVSTMDSELLNSNNGSTARNTVMSGLNNEASIRRREIARLDGELDGVGASAAALAGLHPLEYDPDNKFSVAAAYGSYDGSSAAALGAFYRPNENVMINFGASMGSGENLFTVGVAFALDKNPNYGKSTKRAMLQNIKTLQMENGKIANDMGSIQMKNKELAQQNAALNARLDAIEKMLAKKN